MIAALWIIPLGLLAGIAVGSLGAGGSILTVPALVYLLHQTPQAATTGSLIIVALTAAVAMVSHQRNGNVKIKQGLIFALIGIVGSFAGSQFAKGISSALLLSLFAVLLFVVAFLMWRRLRRTVTASVKDAEPKIHPVALITTASGVGFLTGFFGVGGGFAVVPALVLALGLSMPAAVGTSLLVIVCNTTTALGFRIGNGIAIDWFVVLPFAVVAAIGSLVGAKIAQRVSQRHLSVAFIVMLILIAGYMAAVNVPAVLIRN